MLISLYSSENPVLHVNAEQAVMYKSALGVQVVYKIKPYHENGFLYIVVEAGNPRSEVIPKAEGYRDYIKVVDKTHSECELVEIVGIDAEDKRYALNDLDIDWEAITSKLYGAAISP